MPIRGAFLSGGSLLQIPTPASWAPLKPPHVVSSLCTVESWRHSYEHRSHPSKKEILFSSTLIKEKAEASQDKDRHLLRRVLGHLGGHKAARQRQKHETVMGDPAPWKLHAAGHTLPTQVGSQEVLERHSTAFPCHPHRYAPATGDV